ncbi:hypothetical protein LX36DRAFT_310587 [Colletotrichum falcatum]|nr:hypothetical protein LX36DRAFT_310587 [Colletotrichum falcatum]
MNPDARGLAGQSLAPSQSSQWKHKPRFFLSLFSFFLVFKFRHQLGNRVAGAEFGSPKRSSAPKEKTSFCREMPRISFHVAVAGGRPSSVNLGSLTP